MILNKNINIFVVFLCLLIIVFAPEFYQKYVYIGSPLIGDELVYANPRIQDGLHTWFDVAFGHPPGWFLINFF